MTNQTKIEWTDFTVNPWEGCQKVGPGCDHCYAEARDKRFTGGSHWGPGAPRRKVKGGIAKLRKINRDAPQFREEHGHWPRVFCSSLSDVFDNAVPLQWVDEAFEEMNDARDTRIQLLTKRVGNVFKRIPATWHDGGWPQHVGLMITVVNQAEADRDIPKLLDLKARLGIPWVGISYEPALAPIEIREWFHDEGCTGIAALSRGIACPCRGYGGPHEVTLDWVICGGESGRDARPMHPDWARSVRDQCAAAGTAFLFKQWGEYADHTEIHASNQSCRGSSDLVILPSGGVLGGGNKSGGMVSEDWHERGAAWMCKVGKTRAGRLLDGVEHNGFPGALV